MSLILSGSDGVSDINGSASTPAIRGTDANTGIFFGTDVIGFSEGGVQCGEFNASGNLKLTGNLSVGGATPATSGSGITFPATASASSDPNTLDDYEEGTFTATLSGASAPPSTPITSTSGYVKIGKLVTVNINFSNVDTTGASGNLVITGLPFAADGAYAQIGCSPMMYNLTSTSNYDVWYITSSTLNLYYTANASAWGPENISAGAGKYLWTTVTYTAFV